MKLPIRPALCAAAALLPVLTAAQERPNIIFFLVDDMGWQETSVPFWREKTPLNERYRTPNMERLARLGVKFTEAYACPVSSPSRCSLMTGMNAARHRVTNWTLQYDVQTDVGGGPLTLPEWNWNGIQPEAVATAHDRSHSAVVTPLPQLLHDNGYYTIHCGKAHFGAETTSGAEPRNFGFDVNIAGAANGGPASYLGERHYGKGSFHINGLEKYYADSVFLSEALTREAIEALKVPIGRKQPFYLYMSHYAIHVPYDEDRRFSPNYRTADGKGVFDQQLQAPLNQQEINHAALVEGMDKSLGDLLDFLEAQPEVAANTIVLFMSDNGGQAVGPRQGRPNRDQNFPARGGKGSAYQGGVHEPMIVYWPGVTQAGAVNDNRVMIEDFFPSILEMAGVKKYSTSQHVDGTSFVELLRDNDKKRERPILWHFPNRWGESQDTNEGYGAYSALLDGDFHLIYFWETQEVRLYNIKEDIGEENDLAAEMPKETRRLAKRLTRALKKCDAQRPTVTATGQLAPWPDEAL